MSEEAEAATTTQKAPEPDEEKPATFVDDDSPNKGADVASGSDGGASKALMALLGKHPFWDLYLKTEDRSSLPWREPGSVFYSTLFFGWP